MPKIRKKPILRVRFSTETVSNNMRIRNSATLIFFINPHNRNQIASPRSVRENFALTPTSQEIPVVEISRLRLTAFALSHGPVTLGAEVSSRNRSGWRMVHMVGTGHFPGLERNHYAVVAVDSAGLELRGWDFRTLDAAEKHGEQLRLKGLRIEVWSRDELGRKLARLLPALPPNSKWHVIPVHEETRSEIRNTKYDTNSNGPKRETKNQCPAGVWDI
jgi:hypothetical protein